MSNSDELMRKHWRDHTKVTTAQWTNCMIKLAEGGNAGASDQELFRTSLQKNPLRLDMWHPLQTVSQVGKLTTEYSYYDESVNGNSNEQERKNQLSNLEKKLVLIGEGSEAKSEMAAFFTTLRNDKVT